MKVCYHIILELDGKREIYRSTYFDNLKSARLFAKSVPTAVAIGRRNSQGCLFYKL